MWGRKVYLLKPKYNNYKRMHRKFYYYYLLLNILISAIFIMIVMYPKSLLLNYWMVLLCWILGIILKLQNVVVQTRKYNHAEHKAAPVMSGIVVFIIVGAALYLLNMTQYYVEYAFITALSTGNMSYCYTP